MFSATGYLPSSTLPRRNKYVFFGSGPNWAHFWVFGAIIPVKKCQIELKVWPQVLLIVVQMLFESFWKIRIFTETGRTQNLTFWSNSTPIYPLKIAEIKNRHWAIQINQNRGTISFQSLMKTIITFCAIWPFFGYTRAQGQ